MEYKDILLKHKNNMISREKQYNEEELWKMKYLVWSNLHPDT